MYARVHVGALTPAAQSLTVCRMASRRYARAKGESTKDKLTYHSAILLEWDHGMYTTVAELATLHGVGGRHGKANWWVAGDGR